jgi:acyl-CoA thioesterase
MDEESERWSAIRDLINDSPFYRYMDMRVVEAADGRSKLTMRVKPEMRNLYGICHGGAIATILDSSCGIALGTMLEEGKVIVTVDMRVNYIANLGSGVLTGEGMVVHRGSQTGVVTAEIRDENGELVAVGMSTHLICSPGDVRMADYQAGRD